MKESMLLCRIGSRIAEFGLLYLLNTILVIEIIYNEATSENQ